MNFTYPIKMEKILNAIIIDDEAKSRMLLHTLLNEYCEGVNTVGFSDNTDEAAHLIKKLQPDVVFLDIEMKGESGFDLMHKLDQGNKAKVVFVTAFREYAIDAIKHGAFDYILKPVDMDEVTACVKKLRTTLTQDTIEKHLPRISIFDKGDIRYFEQKEVLFIQADGRYSCVYLKNGNKYMQTKNLGLFEEELSKQLFQRVHKSYLINTSYISSVNKTNKTLILSGQHTIPFSRKIEVKE